VAVNLLEGLSKEEIERLQRFGRRVAAERKLRGWSQPQLAAMVSASIQAISNMERAFRPASVKFEAEVAAALETTREWLGREEGVAHPDPPPAKRAVLDSATFAKASPEVKEAFRSLERIEGGSSGELAWRRALTALIEAKNAGIPLTTFHGKRLKSDD